MLPFILFFACLSWTAAEFPYADTACKVSVEYKKGDLREPQPLILTSNGKNKEFLYPKDDGRTLRIPKGSSVHLACPGKSNYLQLSGNPKEATATCVRDTIFNVGGLDRNFTTLICKSLPENNAIRTGKPCLGRYSSIDIGFQVNNTFLRTIEVCRNDETYDTYYTKFELSKSIGSFQAGYPRPSKWWTGDYYSELNLQNLYKAETQIDTIARILNSTALAKSRVDKNTQYLNRGHMTARADFVYGNLQRTTFWYLNSAPQWMTFNGGNWNSLEDSVRRFAATRRLDLDVYTGVHGQMTMADVRGKQQPIHLYYSDRKERALPVPKFYWKIIYDPLSKNGTAFVGLNDPFIESITSDVYICNDISSKVKWLTWRPKNINQGVSYACTVDELRKAVATIPPLDVIGVLI